MANCCRIDCRSKGASADFRPILLIDSLEAILPHLRLCEQCCSKLGPEDFLSNSSWAQIEEAFAQSNLPAPARENVKVKFERPK